MDKDISTISANIDYLSNHLYEQIDSTIKVMFLEFDDLFVCTTISGLSLKLILNGDFFKHFLLCDRI